MKLPRKTCPCCGKDVAVYDTRRDGWKRVPCEPWFASHNCPHGKACFPGNPQLNDCPDCKMRGRAGPAREPSEALIDGVRENVNAAMHEALMEVLDPANVQKKAWERAVYDVGYAAERAVRSLLGVKAPRRSR